MPQLEWSPQCSVGDDLLDRQHRAFLTLCTKATQCCRLGGPEADSEFRCLLLGMAEHARTHFAAEAAALMANHCPGVFTHLCDHERYRHVLEGYLDAVDRGQMRPAEVCAFLETWWTDHILTADRVCLEYLTQCWPGRSPSLHRARTEVALI